ncbi:hypothetical protein F2Q70_00016549 [Brassica cretica]|uniref:Uncharacterized protein n=1 Tax=Brassica cretica TaxID=69181 RepID=A0A8S9I4Y8_BRACR|nr:hypothetical protein F2Q70_00016549 [Brassica cretica]
MVRSRWLFANPGSDESEQNSFETHLNLPIDLAGSRMRISLMISRGSSKGFGEAFVVVSSLRHPLFVVSRLRGNVKLCQLNIS